MSNIAQLKLDALARRACGWHFGDETLPLAIAQALAPFAPKSGPNACPFNDPKCVDFCMRPQVCGNEP